MANLLKYWKDYCWSRAVAPRERHLFAGLEAYCMFIGYGRSGHTLHGSLLNAHPEIVLAHELDALAYVERGISRDQLFSLILKKDRWFVARKNQWHGYDYHVPGQWQGRFQKIKVIGDRKAGVTSLRLGKSPQLLDKLRALVRVPLKTIHFVRNPFDNISTMARQSNQSLEICARNYFGICRANVVLLQKFNPGEIAMMRHEDFVARPKEELKKLIGFLGLSADETYLADCAKIVYEKPSQSRLKQNWTPPLIDLVNAEIARHEFFAGYSFTS